MAQKKAAPKGRRGKDAVALLMDRPQESEEVV